MNTSNDSIDSGSYVAGYLHGYCTPVIVAVGVIGNSLNLVALNTARGQRMPSRNYLFALAIADLTFLICGTFETVLEQYLDHSMSFMKAYYDMVLWCRAIGSAALKSSIVFVVIFNLERYISVCHPMQMHKLFKGAFEKTLVVGFCIFSGVISLHYPISYVVIKDVEQHGPINVTHFYMNFRSDTFQTLEAAMSYFDMVVFNITPIVILGYLNCKLICTLRRVARREPHEMHAMVSKGRKPSLLAANSILFAVVFLFLLCYGPQIPARILFLVYGPYNPLLKAYMAVTAQLVFLNASLNFGLYCLVSKRYRSILRYLFHRLLAKLRCEEEPPAGCVVKCTFEWTLKPQRKYRPENVSIRNIFDSDDSGVDCRQ